MISLLFFLIAAIVVAGAVLAVVRAVLDLPLFASLKPYANVVYALVVLLIILIIVSMISGQLPNGWPRVR